MSCHVRVQDSRTEGGQRGISQVAADEEEDQEAVYQARRQTKLIYSDAALHAQVASSTHTYLAQCDYMK